MVNSDRNDLACPSDTASTSTSVKKSPVAFKRFHKTSHKGLGT